MSMPLVVVIDNDQTYLTAVSRVLREQGLEAALYPSAEAFIVSPPKRRPLCVVLDVFLSGMSGLDLLRRLNSFGSDLPVIVTTTWDDPRIFAQARRLGCVACLDKSSDWAHLLRVIRSCDRRR